MGHARDRSGYACIEHGSRSEEVAGAPSLEYKTATEPSWRIFEKGLPKLRYVFPCMLPWQRNKESAVGYERVLSFEMNRAEGAILQVG